MKSTQPIQKNQLGAKDALSKQPDCNTLQTTIKALPLADAERGRAAL